MPMIIIFMTTEEARSIWFYKHFIVLFKQTQRIIKVLNVRTPSCFQHFIFNMTLVPAQLLRTN